MLYLHRNSDVNSSVDHVGFHVWDNDTIGRDDFLGKLFANYLNVVLTCSTGSVHFPLPLKTDVVDTWVNLTEVLSLLRP